MEGQILYHGQDLYGSNVDPVEVRKLIGMVFQKPNPFPKSIYDNVAFGPRVLGMKGGLDDRVEKALHHAVLWDEVKDRLKENALSLSGGQQQRLCIARCLAVEPEVLLMDEPASALDPISTTRIEDLMHELKREYTIVIVTHNMQQAARVADMTAFFSVDVAESGARAPACSSSTTRPRRSSRTPATNERRTTSPDASARGRAPRFRRPLPYFGDEGATVRITLQEDLNELQATLHEEADLVLRSLRGAVNALVEQDEELADEVIAFDDEVDQRYFAIEEGIQSLLARQTPVAIDLRLVLAMLHINLHLERMADYCVTIAKLTKLAGKVDDPHPTLIEAFEEMGARAEEMIRVAMESFRDRDLEHAETLARDGRADRPCEPARRAARALARLGPARCRSGACGCS